MRGSRTSDLRHRLAVGVLTTLLRPLAYQVTLLATEAARDLDVDAQMEVTATATATHGEPGSGDEQHLARLHTRGDDDGVLLPAEPRHPHGPAEQRCRRGMRTRVWSERPSRTRNGCGATWIWR